MSRDQLPHLFHLLENDPNDSFLLYAIAQEYVKNNNANEALKFYKKITKADPDYFAVYYHLGKLYEQLGQNELAIATYRQGLSVTKRLGETHAYGELQSALNLISDDAA